MILIAATAMLLAGCVLGEGRAEDTMMIINRSDAPITVTYEVGGRVNTEARVVELHAGERSYVSPRLFGTEPCLLGEFVARSGDEVIDRLPQPCKEQLWEVTGP